jgi:hypothetical protein
MSARGVLFLVLAAALAGIGFEAAANGSWVIAVAGAALSVWMADLARRDLGLRRAGR